MRSWLRTLRLSVSDGGITERGDLIREAKGLGASDQDLAEAGYREERRRPLASLSRGHSNRTCKSLAPKGSACAEAHCRRRRLPGGCELVSDDILDSFDFVVASIHGRFRLDRKAQTERLLRAVSNRHTTVLGHMTGRQLQRRLGYEIDVEKVLHACAKDDVAVEINAHPWRLDLDWRWHQVALDFGCIFSIDPDAHSIRELDHMHWGVKMARKGGVPADRVLNAMTFADITGYMRQKRRSFARVA